MANRLHVIGGYAEQRVDNSFHHLYDPATDSWTRARACRAAPTMSAWSA
jgi:hypothetical protein